MTNHTELNTLVPWQSGPKTRGGLSIVWTCLALIVTCTWTTLHLNVPGRDDTSTTQLLRKVKWMLIMVIFPELVFARAVVELKMALDDYFEMAGQTEKLQRVGWCVHPSTSVRWIQRILGGVQMPSPIVQESDVIDNVDDGRSYHAPVTIDNTDAPTASGSLATRYNFPYERNCYREMCDGLAEEEPAWDEVTSAEKPRYTEAEFSSAGKNCSEHRCYRWTLTHTIFANMGGLTSPMNNGSEVLYTGRHLAWGNPGRTDILRKNHFTEDDINDKSKGDAFVRALWVLQIARLLMDLIARTYQKYPITPFEIITASFAALSFIAVIIQSKKPLDVRKPICLRPQDEKPDYDSRGFSSEWSGWTSFTKKFLSRELADYFHSEPKRIMNDHYRNEFETLLLSMLTGSTIIFGLIHCGAWNYAFPSVIEKWMWRAGALSGLALPLLVLTFTVLLHPVTFKLSVEHSTLSQEQYKKVEWFSQLLMESIPGYKMHVRLFDFMQYGLLALHLVSRIALIVIALASFRSAPQGVYVATWASFIPTVQ
ncbi:uncharacterized protein N0V89_004790 [Didymosphaeria variabile]|uniref:Uncharacterized protein n=1 Tax=Didymosphaeria variabile TaxID=1932322 RepID=A0A9W9CCQ8_9PLEO|nr:uncharacterized protein N0V89_004790 [Didymosphaeria variabile]KAJ4356754.1 hypothetical protein N0V89_004790 [Didymosphaeria variabile]